MGDHDLSHRYYAYSDGFRAGAGVRPYEALRCVDDYDRGYRDGQLAKRAACEQLSQRRTEGEMRFADSIQLQCEEYDCDMTVEAEVTVTGLGCVEYPNTASVRVTTMPDGWGELCGWIYCPDCLKARQEREKELQCAT